MPYDGRILARARARLEAARQANEEEHKRRVAGIYRSIPEIADIDAQLAAQWKDLALLAISRDPRKNERIAAMRDENLSLQMRRAELLVEHSFPADYLDEKFSCPLCRDTGSLSGGMCDCLKRLYRTELSMELSPLLRRGDESFENFDLTLYSDQYSESFSCVPRQYMGAVADACRSFADAFPDVNVNLMLRGASGLGKTYLSGCIARVVAGKGYSVCYDSVSSAFDFFERQKFSRDPEEQEAARTRVRRMLDCDLMILDDLGTEMTTPVSMNALYTLINTRLTAGKRMIISTNLTPEEIAGRYSEAISSRLAGEFLQLRFCGTDIRKLLKSR